MQYIALK